jgi:hypothetical protein
MFNPPKKLFYRPSEVSAEWDIKACVDQESFDQYIYKMKVLRLAFPTSNIEGECKYLKITSKFKSFIDNEVSLKNISSFNPSEATEEQSLDMTGGCEFYDDNLTYMGKRMVLSHLMHGYDFCSPDLYKLSEEDLIDQPEYLYFNSSLVGSTNHFYIFETFDGDNLLLLRPSFFPDGQCPLGDHTVDLLTFNDGLEQVVITQQEKERFEKKYSPSKKKEEPLDDNLNPKTRNSYLKTIYALSNALIDGLTGQPYKDAEAILFKLSLNQDEDEGKSTEPPVTSKTLAAYLKDAKKLDEKQ